jgi:hypothetical protein
VRQAPRALLLLTLATGACRGRPARAPSPASRPAPSPASAPAAEAAGGALDDPLLLIVDGTQITPIACFGSTLTGCLAHLEGKKNLTVRLGDGELATIKSIPTGASTATDSCLFGLYLTPPPKPSDPGEDYSGWARWPVDAKVQAIAPRKRKLLPAESKRVPRKHRTGTSVLSLDVNGDGKDEHFYLAEGWGRLEQDGKMLDSLDELELSNVTQIHGVFAHRGQRVLVVHFIDRESSARYGEGASGLLALDPDGFEIVGRVSCNP